MANIKVKGKAVYTYVYQPNEYKGSSKYQVELVVDTPTSDKLKKLGLQQAQAGGINSGVNKSHASLGFPGDVFKFTRRHKDGVVIPVTGVDQGTPIGHGSEVEVEFSAFETNGMTLGILQGMHVHNLVEVEGKDSSAQSIDDVF